MELNLKLCDDTEDNNWTDRTPRFVFRYATQLNLLKLNKASSLTNCKLSPRYSVAVETIGHEAGE